MNVDENVQVFDASMSSFPHLYPISVAFLHGCELVVSLEMEKTISFSTNSGWSAQPSNRKQLEEEGEKEE